VITFVFNVKTLAAYGQFNPKTMTVTCLGGAVVRRRTRDRKVADSTPSQGAIKSTRSTQPFIPPG